MYDEPFFFFFLVFQFFSSYILLVCLFYFNLFQVKKGNSIGQFLELARRQIADQFSELRTLDAGNLIYVKEDLIIPHVCLLRATFFFSLFYPELLLQIRLSFSQGFTFYDFIINKARGKSGPLFHFDIRADVRLVADVRLEKEDSHPGASYMRC
jgi:protein FAM50